MRSLGGGGGLDVTQDMRPPKSLYIQVCARPNSQAASSFSATVSCYSGGILETA